MSKILLVTDAWKPQVNGVVTTLVNLVDQANKVILFMFTIQADVRLDFHYHFIKK